MDKYQRRWYRLKSCLRDRLLYKGRKDGKPITRSIQEGVIIQVLEVMDKLEEE